MNTNQLRNCLVKQDCYGNIPDDFHKSAVLVLLQQRESDWSFVLIKRAESLSRHGGEIAFAGGRCDAQDSGPIATALRETREELSIPEEQVTVLGLLPFVRTLGSGFAIVPVVGILDSEFQEFILDPGEVESVFHVPVSFFFQSPVTLGPDNYFMRGHHFREHIIWGATLKVIQELLRCVKSS